MFSDSGREPRHPFLDENVVSFFQNVPFEYRISENGSSEFTDKILIRELVKSLGVPLAAMEPKVAIQFGR